MAENIEIKITAAVENAGAAKSVQELRKSLKELNSLALQTQGVNDKAFKKIAGAIGEATDKMEDMRDEFVAFRGSALEKFNATLNLTKEGLMNLDFDKITMSLKNLGGVVKANPLLLLATVIMGIVESFDKLAASGGLIGRVFTTIGNIIGGVKDVIMGLLSAIGLVGPAVDVIAKQTKQVYDDSIKYINELADKTSEASSKILKAQGKINDEQEKQIGSYEKFQDELQKIDKKYKEARNLMIKQSGVLEARNIDDKIKLQKKLDIALNFLGKQKAKEVKALERLLQTDLELAREEALKEERDNAEKSNKGKVEDIKSYQKEIEDIETDFINDKFENEKRKLELETDRLVKAVRVSNAKNSEKVRYEKDLYEKLSKDIIKIETDRQNRIDDIRRRQRDIELNLQPITDFEKKKTSIINKYSDDVDKISTSYYDNEDDRQKDLYLLQEQLYKDIEKLDEESYKSKQGNRDQDLDEEKKVADAKVEIAKKGKADKEKADKELADLQQQAAVAAIETAQRAADAIFEIQRANNQRMVEAELQSNQDKYDRELSDYDIRQTEADQRANNEIDRINNNTEVQLKSLELQGLSEEELQKKRTELELKAMNDSIAIEDQRRQYDVDTASERQKIEADINNKRIKEETRIKREAFEKEKKMAITQALINGALAITKVFATTPLPAGLIVAGAQAAATAIEIATIKKQKPAFAKGGLVSGPGSGTSDSIDARISNGESIINADSTSMFMPLLSAINQVGGGRAFKADVLTPVGTVTTPSQPIIKTYVTESDMTSSQKSARRRDNFSKF